MNTKKCNKCGWEYPLITPYYTCKFCGTAFTTGICSECGKYSEDIIVYGGQRCRTCYNKLHSKYRHRSTSALESSKACYYRGVKEAEKRFKCWTERLKSIHTHSLTEDEWLTAVSYFGSCALCNNDSIDARGYFISFKDGGSYNRCNVIPLCEKCATETKIQYNPFKRLNPRLNSSLAVSRGLGIDKLERVVEYLQQAMEDAENE